MFALCKTFPSNYNLNMNNSEYSKVTNTYLCECCGSTFMRKNEFENHISMCINDDEKIPTKKKYQPAECPHCSIKFTRKDSLKRHINIKHKLLIFPY